MTDPNRYRAFRAIMGEGGIVGERARVALDLARAEELRETAEELGVATLDWQDEDEPYEHGILTDAEVAAKFDSNEWTGPYFCVLTVGEEEVAGLGGIVLGPAGTDDPYARLVAAELSDELGDALRQAIAARVAQNKTQRTEHAFRVVLHYQQLRGETDDLEESILDLATELLHLCDQYGVDVDCLQRESRDNYYHERAAAHH